jgi:hypothetical protein
MPERSSIILLLLPKIFARSSFERWFFQWYDKRMPVLEKPTTERVELPIEDRALARLVRIIARDFKGNATAFFNRIPNPNQDARKEVKKESLAVKKFVKCL